MCIVFVYHSNDPNSKYKLVIAANRDEYMSRPAKAADYHPDFPEILCGIDLEKGVEGGTWLGVTKSGKFSALTNILVTNPDASKLARGRLVMDYLRSETEPLDYLRLVQSRNHREFNLLAGKLSSTGKVEIGFYSNCDSKDPRMLEEGVNVVACTKINGDWRKISHGRTLFRDIMSGANDTDAEVMTDKLLDTVLSDTTCLYPDQAIIDVKSDALANIDILKMYCSVRIKGSPHYGTRMQTVILVDKNNTFHFSERSLTNCAEDSWTKKSFQFDAVQ